MKDNPTKSSEKIHSKDLKLVNDLNAALQKEKHSGLFWMIGLLFCVFGGVRDLGL